MEVWFNTFTIYTILAGWTSYWLTIDIYSITIKTRGTFFIGIWVGRLAGSTGT
jgi:hypothetical protein